MNLNAANLNIAALAAKEESRFKINGILVTNEYTAVTDGHVLVTVSLPKQFNGSAPEPPGFEHIEKLDRPFLLPSATALDLAKHIPAKPTIPGLGQAYIGASANAMVDDPAKPSKQKPAEFIDLMTTDLETAHRPQVRRLTGNFPEVERCIPMAENARFGICLDLDLLIPLLQQAKKFHNGTCGPHPVTLRFTTADEGVRLDCHNDEQKLVAVVMPIRHEQEISERFGSKAMMQRSQAPEPPKLAAGITEKVLDVLTNTFSLPEVQVTYLKDQLRPKLAEVLGIEAEVTE